MASPNKQFQILNAIDSQEITSQRQISEVTGISLGQVNYVLKKLFVKGLVKLKNFKENPHKFGYIYFLTPSGIEEKSKLAVNFVLARLEEYENLRTQLAERLGDISDLGHKRVIFVGHDIVSELVLSTINEKTPALTFKGSCRTLEDLKALKPESYDVALLFNVTERDALKATSAVDIAQEKLINLW